MRAIWKGAITFGLVNVPVKLYSATEDHDVSLHQVHDKDGGRIRYQRRCEVCGRIIDYEHIDKAYDDGERTVVLTKDDLRSLPEERSREIDVVEFVPSDQLDPILFDRSYFLEPDSSSSKAYVLLRRTLEQTDRTAIVHFALRQKTRLAALRVRNDVLMLQTLLWDDEVRVANFPSLDERVRISAKELDMSSQLVESFANDFESSQFTDDYQAQLRTLIEAKLAEGEALDTEATFGVTEKTESGGEVLDLMEALRRSVEKNSGQKNSGQKNSGNKSTTKAASNRKPASSKSTGEGSTKAKSTARKSPAKARDTGAEKTDDAATEKKKPTRRKSA